MADVLAPGVRARLIAADYPRGGARYGYGRYVGCDVTVESPPRAYGVLEVVDVTVHDDRLDLEVRQVVETRHLEVDGHVGEATPTTQGAERE